MREALVDYYVEAVDTRGNIRRSPIQHVYVGPGTGGGTTDPAVSTTPDPSVAGQAVEIAYNPTGRPLAGSSSVRPHCGFNNWGTILSPDPAMSWNAARGRWLASLNVPAGATQLDVVFHNGAGVWDNNSGADWHLPVAGGVPDEDWEMGGVLDTAAALLATNGAMKLSAGLRGDVLYVACSNAGEGNDHFVFLADVPGAMRSAPWGKAGQVSNWAAFLADENSNDYEGWSDAFAANAAATGPNGGVLEGTINLRDELGTLPKAVFLAAAAFGNGDGGGLRASRSGRRRRYRSE